MYAGARLHNLVDISVELLNVSYIDNVKHVHVMYMQGASARGRTACPGGTLFIVSLSHNHEVCRVMHQSLQQPGEHLGIG